MADSRPFPHEQAGGYFVNTVKELKGELPPVPLRAFVTVISACVLNLPRLARGLVM